jgi:dephospho-CoA kinase
MSSNSQDAIIVGLTGQSGAGKTTASKIFKENGFFVLNADSVARYIVSMDETTKALAEHFGDIILKEDGKLNRRALADIVFTDSNKLQELNDMLFPLICKKVRETIGRYRKKYVLLDAPQLFESGMNKECDFVVSVVAPHDVLVERIMGRDIINKKSAEDRLASQLSEEFFRDNSDFVIDTANPIQETSIEVQKIIDKIVTRNDSFEF